MANKPEEDIDLPAVERVWRENGILSDRVIILYRTWVRRFTAYCRKHDLQAKRQLTLAGVNAFAEWYSRSRKIDLRRVFESSRGALGTCAHACRTLGEALPPWIASSDSIRTLPPLMRQFADHVRHLRGNPEATIHKKIDHVEKFLEFLRSHRRPLHSVQLRDVDAFVVHVRKRYERITVADMCSSLRGFFRFLHVTGRLSTDLASSIAAPVIRKSEQPYRTLPWADVQRILRAVDRGTRCGRRDYALLLMMSVYGLGAGEVIRLRLDDIDWRANVIHVTRPKTGVEFFLPLLPAVARALVSYLRQSRPRHAATRDLFVRIRAPYKRLSASSAVRHILHRHAHRAGIVASFLGTHVLRHTHACRQMELGTRPKVISDILGHRDPESISAYLRVSTERLRRIALPVPT